MTTTINGRTPEEIKKGLNHCSEDGCKQCPYKDDCDMADGFSVLAGDANAYIRQLENQIGELTEKVAQLEAAQPKWFSVKEKLPENDDNYLVFTSDRNDAVIATYYGDGEWLEYDLTNLIPLVTHWMPLPEPPETE